MLKIKRDIDLDILKNKYGFKYFCEEESCGDPSEDYYEEYFYECYQFLEPNSEDEVLISVSENREILMLIDHSPYKQEALEVLFNLISDGLVEKAGA